MEQAGYRLATSVATLRRVLAAEGIDQPQLGGRQHFLRWETPTTARLWDDQGLDDDSTLSFADRPGFCCCTSRPETVKVSDDELAPRRQGAKTVSRYLDFLSFSSWRLCVLARASLLDVGLMECLHNLPDWEQGSAL